MNKIDRIKNYFNNGDYRSQLAKKNIVLLFGNKGLGIIISFVLVPLTINYINPTQYGIWLTISSIIQWMSLFDFGFAHGFRNKFAVANANNDIILARKYVSTTYAVLTIIFGITLIVGFLINSKLEWSNILNITIENNNEITKIVYVLIFFLCIQLIVNVYTTLLSADQKPALSSLISTFGQLFVLIIIFVLTKTTQGSLFYLAIVMAATPCLTIIIASIKGYKTKYKSVSPSLLYVDFSLVKNILGLGSKFFLIQVSMLFIFQFTNIILTKVLGPDAVTQYSISFKYFGIISTLMNLILAPFWSAFTDAYTKKEFDWMKNIYEKLSKIWFLLILLSIVMYLIAPYFYKLWIGDSVRIPKTLSFILAIYSLLSSRAGLYMILMNGTGHIMIQLIVYCLFAVSAVPLMTYFTRLIGIEGVVIIPIIFFVFLIILGDIQIKKIMNNKARSIWIK